MKKEKIEIIITICMAVLLVILVYKNIISKLSKRTSGGNIEGTKVSEVGYNLGKGFRSREELLRYVNNLEWTRNPFIYIGQRENKKGGGRKIVVEGIIWDAKEPKAIIDGQVVGVGDDVDGKKVVSIEENAVYLTDGHKEERVRLFQEE